MKMWPVFLLLLLAVPATAAEDLPGVPARRRLAATLNASFGAALPAGGHWGDASSGFKPSPSGLFSVAFPAGGLLSWGLEAAHNTSHAYRRDDERRLSLSSLSPFARVDLPCGSCFCHAQLGAGLYYWDMPGFSSPAGAAGNSSGSSAGFSAGGGVMRDFGSYRLGLETRWQHVAELESRGLDLDAVNNFNVYFLISVPVFKGGR